MRGIPLPIVSPLLGHMRQGMTLRYAHVGDHETEAASERIAEAISRGLEGGAANPNCWLYVLVLRSAPELNSSCLTQCMPLG